MADFHKLYCQLFNIQSTYNTHVYATHMIDQRVRNGMPLHEWSAYKYEALYAFLKTNYRKGTHNTPSQALRGYLLSQLSTSGHKCPKKRNIRISPGSTTQRDDSLIFDTLGRFLEVKEEIQERRDQDQSMRRYVCKVLPRQRFTTEDMNLPHLPWEKVGVYLAGRDQVPEERVMIKRGDVRGKLAKAGKFLVTVPKPWLMLYRSVK